MTSPRSAAIILATCLSLLFLGSCRPARMSSFVRTGESIRAVAAASGKPSHIRLTHTAAAEAMAEYRIRPSSTVTGHRALTLADCRALALANSLDIQQARLEEAAKNALKHAARVKMLPHVSISGDVEERDNQSYSFSEVLGREGSSPLPGSSGEGVNQYSTGRDRGKSRWILETKWSPTEAALAYYLYRSGGNDERKKHYARVRTAQRLVGVVDASFARLLGLRAAMPIAGRLLDIRRDVARRMKEMFDRELVPVEDYYASAQKLIRARRLQATLRNRAERQRNILASAMQLSPDYCVDGGFRLVGAPDPPMVCPDVNAAEMTAVKNRPEAYVAGLDHLNSMNDLKRTIIKYFPRITGFWRQTRDDDKHLYNRQWREVGLQVYIDLVAWVSNGFERQAATKLAKKSYREIGSVALGICAEVRAASLKYSDELDRLGAAQSARATAEKVWSVHRKRASKGVTQRLFARQSHGDTLQEEVEAIRAAGETQAAYAELQAAMGTNYCEPFPD